MVDIKLKNDLLKELCKENTYERLRNMLMKFKLEGGKQDVAYNTLVETRTVYIESGELEKEDIILELMDIVAGYCYPTYKIWENNNHN